VTAGRNPRRVPRNDLGRKPVADRRIEHPTSRNLLQVVLSGAGGLTRMRECAEWPAGSEFLEDQLANGRRTGG
jgi:hypothetical protein